MTAKSFGVHVKGGKELAADFARLENAIRGEVLGRAAMAGALVIETEAKLRVPRRTSTLARSLHTELVSRDAASAAAVVGTNVEYGPYVEFGTGAHGPKGVPITVRYTRGGARRFGPSRPVEVSYTFEGMTARPYLMPALEEKKEQAFEDIAAAVWEQVKEIARK